MAQPSSSLPAATAPEVEPGDRFELVRDGARLGLPRDLGPDGFEVGAVVDLKGRPLAFGFDPASRRIIIEAAGGSDEAGGSAWLECLAPGQFRLDLQDGPAGAQPGAGGPGEGGIRIDGDPGDLAIIRRGGEPGAGLKEFELALRATKLATNAGFDRLIALPMIREVEPLEHQIRTVKAVLRRLRGRALLCDEVGLGKTVEAGLILAELFAQGAGPVGPGPGPPLA